jgi:hypothetical protein
LAEYFDKTAVEEVATMKFKRIAYFYEILSLLKPHGQAKYIAHSLSVLRSLNYTSRVPGDDYRDIGSVVSITSSLMWNEVLPACPNRNKALSRILAGPRCLPDDRIVVLFVSASHKAMSPRCIHSIHVPHPGLNGRLKPPVLFMYCLYSVFFSFLTA